MTVTSRDAEPLIIQPSAAHWADFRFAAAVAGFGMILRESPHKGDATFASMLDLARNARGEDRQGYRTEFIKMVQEADGLARVQRADARTSEPRSPR